MANRSGASGFALVVVHASKCRAGVLLGALLRWPDLGSMGQRFLLCAALATGLGMVASALQSAQH